MAQLLPFQAVRYNDRVNANKVIAPPYDQISPEMQDALYARDPHNFVRLILGKIQKDDTETSNRYTRAADDLHQWIKDGTLIEEDRPAFFAYEQSFDLGTVPERGLSLSRFTRFGFVGLTRLEPFGTGVLPHEKTFPKPKEDRLNLMKACKANLEQIFFLYDDPKHVIREMLAPVRLARPLLTCRDDLGTTHTIWRIAEPEMIAKIQTFLAPKTLLVADGHHRYETSLEYERQMKEIWCDSSSDDAPFHYRLGTFVSLQDPGMVILPTHRVVKGVPDEQMGERLSKFFEIKPCDNLESLMRDLQSKASNLGLVTKDRFQLLSLKDSVNLDKEFADAAPSLRRLGVVTLQRLVFDQALPLPQDRLDQFVTYVRWPEDAVKLVASGSHQMAFLLNPVSPMQMKEVSEAGEKMPHKSTDFYPKLWSGLLFYKMEM